MKENLIKIVVKDYMTNTVIELIVLEEFVEEQIEILKDIYITCYFETYDI